MSATRPCDLQWWFRYFYGKSRYFAPWANKERARLYCYRRAREVVIKQAASATEAPHVWAPDPDKPYMPGSLADEVL